MMDDLTKIHDASMMILKKTGMRFHHPKIISVLKEKGIKTDGNIAYFKPHQVMEWVAKAPKEFKVFARNYQHNFTIGGDHIEFAPAYGAPFVLENDGTRRNAVIDDFLKFLKLVHQSNRFNVNGGILVEPSDISPEFNAPIMLYHILTHSDKFIIGMEGRTEKVSMAMDLLKIVFGGKKHLIEKPRMLTIINTLSPLQMDELALETMMVYADHGQPMAVTPAAMGGFTAPITMAGLIAIANAETLAGIALTQMLREGTPVAYGIQSTVADMTSGGYVVGSPEFALSLTYGARLAKRYGLPCRGGGAPSDAKAVCVQSGYESMMILSTCFREKINFLIHSAGAIDSIQAMSFEKFMVDLEVMELQARIEKGITINEETLALNIIDTIGPGGEYMTSMHTAKLCRKETWTPKIGLRGIRPSADPVGEINHNIQTQMEKMIAAYKSPSLPTEIIKELQGYLKGKGVPMKQLSP